MSLSRACRPHHPRFRLMQSTPDSIRVDVHDDLVSLIRREYVIVEYPSRNQHITNIFEDTRFNHLGQLCGGFDGFERG
jgi:hypothetical protein